MARPTALVGALDDPAPHQSYKHFVLLVHRALPDRERLVRSPLPIGNLTSNGDSPDEQLQRPSEDRPCRKLNLLDALECIGACWAE